MPRMTVAVTNAQYKVLMDLPANIIGLLHKIGVQFVADDFIAALEDNNTEPGILDIMYTIFSKTPPAHGRKKVMSIPMGVYKQIKDVTIPYGNGNLVSLLVDLGFKSPVEPPPPPTNTIDVIDDFSTIKSQWINPNPGPTLTIANGIANFSGPVSSGGLTLAWWEVFDINEGVVANIDCTSIVADFPLIAGLIFAYDFDINGNPQKLALGSFRYDSSVQQQQVEVVYQGPTGMIVKTANRLGLGRMQIEWNSGAHLFNFAFNNDYSEQYPIVLNSGTDIQITTPTAGICALFVSFEGSGTVTDLKMDNFYLQGTKLIV